MSVTALSAPLPSIAPRPALTQSGRSPQSHRALWTHNLDLVLRFQLNDPQSPFPAPVASRLPRSATGPLVPPWILIQLASAHLPPPSALQSARP